VARKEVRHQEDPAVVLWTRPHSDKHHFFAHDPGNSCLLAVGQVSGQVQGLAGMVERSHRNLALLSPLSGIFAEINITLPRLLDSEGIGNSTFYVRSALEGETLDSLISDCHRRDDRETLERLMTQALDLQIRIQDLLTKHVVQDAYQIEPHYFENYLGLPPEEDASLSQSGSLMVQHGDFAPVNILLNPTRPEWGVIDWEWMGTSFPPLFDLFTFCSRVHYLQRRRKGLTFFQEYFQIPNGAVYSFFVRYMKFQCGKYRHAMPGYPDFQHSYEECLKWSIKNKERFICR
jgi:hypothetical protein